ncbi:MAG: WG repeat-containing protein [Candidatus Melainabacteria bacterium]|nr:WG repeat-containing protein [Candidatus Melainabacteria bacterium]
MKLKQSTKLNVSLLVTLMLGALSNGVSAAEAAETKPAGSAVAAPQTNPSQPLTKPASPSSPVDKKDPKVQQIPAGKPVSIGKQRSMQLPEPPSLFFINKLGKQVIPYMFYDASQFQEGLAAALIADQWGYVDKEGNVQIGANFDLAGDFKEGLATVKVKDNWGYIDRTGKFVIEPRFAGAEDFKNGYAAVQLSKDSPEFPQKANDQLQSILKDPEMPALKKAWMAIASSRAAGIIDKKGKFLFDPFYSSIQNFSDDLALAKEGATIVYLNKKGQVTLRPQGQDAKSFSDGMAAIKVKDKWGFINTSGAFAVKPTFDEVEDFQKGLAPARLSGKWGFIDKKGKWAIQPKYDVIWEGFQSGVAVVGKDVCPIPNTHADVTRVSTGFLVARRTGRTKDFDESTTPLEPGYFAYPDYRFTLIGKDEKPLFEKQYENIGPLSDGLRVVRLDGKFGYMDNLGNVMIQPTYKSADPFSDGMAIVKEGPTKPRAVERNETLLKQAVPALVNDPELLKKDIAVCTEVIKLDPENAQAYRDRGYMLCNLGRFKDALADFEQVTKLCSSSSEGYYWRGMAHMQLSGYTEAVIDFTNAIEMEPNRPQNLFGRALSLKSLHREALALNDINRAIAIYDHPYYHRIRGQILRELDQTEASIVDLQIGRRAPSLEPWPSGPRTQEEITTEVSSLEIKLKTAREKQKNHAEIALLSAELADSLEDLRRLKTREDKVLELEDLCTRAVVLRREALKEAEVGSTDKTVSILFKNELANALAHLAAWHVRSQSFDKATPLYDESLKLATEIGSPLKQADYLTDIAKMYVAQKNYDKALELLKQALDMTRNPADAPSKVVRGQALNAYSIVLNHKNQTMDADISMNEASELLNFGIDITFLPSPPPLPENASAEASYELALQCKSLGLIEMSRTYMKKALERSSSSEKVKNKAERFLNVYIPKRPINLPLTKAFQKGRTSELTGDFLNAEKFYKECIDAEPAFEWPYQSLARVKRVQGDLEGAEKLLKKALSINPDYLDAWLELARVDQLQGDKSKAKASVDKALKLDPDSQLAQFEQQQLSIN